MNFDDLNETVGLKDATLDLDEMIDDPFMDAPKPRRVRKTKVRAFKVDLVISDELKSELMADLAECSHEYAMWLRVLMLRVLIRTPALGRLKGRSNYNLTQTCEFLGFENFEPFAEDRSLAEIRNDLGQVLASWEKQVGFSCCFPVALKKNLSALAGIIGLNPLETDILGLAVLIHAESTFEGCCQILGAELAGYSIERILAPMLGQKAEAVAHCLQRSEKLGSSGLLTIDLSGRYHLRQLIDLLTVTFAARMLVPQTDIRKIVEGFVRPAPASELSARDYVHAQTNFDICKKFLKKATEQRMVGVNILMYGKPGSGKTELSRLMANELQLQLMEISPCNLVGAPVVPIRRVRNYRIAQSFFKSNPSIILFDECEEILNQVQSTDRSDDEATVPRKSFINKILETNEVPTIWIANSIQHFDEAYLRRFSVCFEMPLPSQSQREKMLAKAVVGIVSAPAQVGIARYKEATPAMYMQTAKVIQTIASDSTPGERDALAIHLMNNTLKAQSKAQITTRSDMGLAGNGFEPGWINSDVDLLALRESVIGSRTGRICLYGPPGTGKTAFGKWLAQEMDVPHLVLKASEILSPYLGETEQNMARAFDAATQQKAVLQFDEVDSFLQDRQKAAKQWEVTQVNEMLTQMENFQGVFIASTNLFQNLDEASLRRFDMAIKFDFMDAEAAWHMLVKTCSILGVDDVEPQQKIRLSRLAQLTPGDFEQVVRRARLLRPQSASEVLRQLESALALKKTSVSRSMGFLAAA